MKIERELKLAVAASASDTKKEETKPKPKTKLVGTVTFRGQPGLNRLKISRVAGHKLTAGHYLALVSVSGASGPVHTIAFTIRR